LTSGYARAFGVAAALGAVAIAASFIVPSIRPKPAPETARGEDPVTAQSVAQPGLDPVLPAAVVRPEPA
jgi:hypothetical protein